MNIKMTLDMFLPDTFSLAFTRREKQQRLKKMLWEERGGEVIILVGGGTPLYELYRYNGSMCAAPVGMIF